MAKDDINRSGLDFFEEFVHARLLDLATTRSF